MLTQEHNDFLTGVGPGTPMGNLLRRFWMPALLSEDLPEPDCAPKRVRLLSEDMVAFRDSSGQVGLVANACPHRGASMFFGRNEEDGLRCVYHGWKFDLAGTCTDMPNEPAESNFKHKIRITAYPTAEAGGTIWAYMGPREHQPAEVPQFEWTRVPEAQRVVSFCLQDCNWVQGVEGGIDSSHVSFLHSTVDSHRKNTAAATSLMAIDKAPEFRVASTDFGLLIGARRKASDTQDYWRVTPFSLPFYTVIPMMPNQDLPYSGHGWVPIDDEQCWLFTYSWHPTRPLSDFGDKPGHNAHYVAKFPGTNNPVPNKDNDYQIDRDIQRTKTFSGIELISTQDRAIQETMGHVYDRTREHLGSADTAIIMMRRLLMNLARDLDKGGTPYAATHNDIFTLRSAGFLLDSGKSFVEACQPMVRVGS